ncbi:hypothetical protein HYZ98_05155 [Candidatus Peregrinibacteria bacterium]|nr:hypothetical protein [Candidatus Peregrinibacteria bacterium]
MRPSILPLLLTALLLSACGEVTITYNLHTDIPMADQKSELTLASMRVIERRLKRIGEDILEKDITAQDGLPSITLTLGNTIARDILTEELIQPFTLRIMTETTDEESADITVAGHGGFTETGITEEHIIWAEAGQDADPSKGLVTLSFTESGRTLMNFIFAQNNGKHVGLFVRERLMSKLLVESAVLRDDIVIRDIPSTGIANIFADDINVGLHVTFVPH